MSIIIGIDAGHGHNTSGKRCDARYDPAQTREWDLNSRAATKVQALLAKYNVKTIRLDDVSGNSDVALSKRTSSANSNNCNLVVSIHHNAGGGNGLESYYQKTLSTASTSYQICKTIHDATIAATKQKDRGLKPSSSTAVGDLAILRDTKMPAVLIEGGFMDNAIDTPRIISEDFSNKLAQGIVNGIVKVFNLTNTEGPTVVTPTPPVTTPTSAYYPTISSASIVDALKKIGVDSSLNNRKKIAIANGITGYIGSYNQNTALLNLLKQGKLKKI